MFTPGKRLIDKILSEAGIAVNGTSPWDIKVNSDLLYSQVLKKKNLGLGEAYMEGWWDCERLDEFFHRILKCKADKKVRGGLQFHLRLLPGIFFNLQAKRRASIIADRHYNIDNDLFMSFLDPYNQYSCGYFRDTEDLAEAQQIKLDMICKKIELSAGDRVLDIGCGWGGFAKYAAEHYGAKITAVNISREQVGYAQDLCKGLPVEVCLCDYRSIRGTFDKVVSIGMFEHVGPKNYSTFMQTVQRCLKQNGIFLLHTIGSNESRSNLDPWINQYIFPNGILPGIDQIGRAIEGMFVVEDWHNLAPHYDKTLMAWNRNFQKAWQSLKSRYSETFKRMWEYYLLSCAGAFRARDIQVWQVVMTKYGARQPRCRF